VESYVQDEYVVDAFSLSPASEISYAKVTVQRVAKNGTELGKYSQLVGKRSMYPIPPKRVWTVADFLGDAAAAQQEARETARWLRLGDFTFSFEIPINPTLKLFDILQIRAAYRDKTYTYKGSISGDIAMTYSPATRDAPGVATMSLSGDAIITGNGV
jgi:hypothetical protein